MAGLTIRVGDLHFTARWEEAAPRTREAPRRAWLAANPELVQAVPVGNRPPDIDTRRSGPGGDP